MSSSSSRAKPSSWLRCSGVMEFNSDCMAAICWAICSSSSSRLWGLPGKKSPNCSMNCWKAASVSWPPSRISSIWFRALNMSFMRCSCSGVIPWRAPAISLK